MDQIELKVTGREVLGKKVRFLRRRGITPVHLFGHGIESLSLQCDTVELRQVLGEAGQTKLIDLKFDGQKTPRTAVVRKIQRDTRNDALLHVDFYQVKMAEAVKVEVPLILVGEPPALRIKGNLMVQDLSTLSIECLPAVIPTGIEVDLTALTEADQSLRVSGIKLDKEIAVLNDPERIIAKIESRPVEKIEEVVAEAVEALEGEEAPEAAPGAEEGAEEE